MFLTLLSSAAVTNEADMFVIYFLGPFTYGQRREKTCLRGFRQSRTQTSLLNYRDYQEYMYEKSLVASLDIILSNKGITKALIRLCGCAGWSGAVFSQTAEDRFCCIAAPISRKAQ